MAGTLKIVVFRPLRVSIPVCNVLQLISSSYTSQAISKLSIVQHLLVIC